MKLYSENENYKLYQGNMLDMLEVIEPESIDSIVTDPPYELGFMGKSWDNSGIAFQKSTWEKCLTVLKPGGYLLAFGGSRTYHRIACAIEDAGFEIRDTIMWLYGCLSEDTEVLTKRGFKKFSDIIQDEEIRVYDIENGIYKWEKPQRWNVYSLNKDTCFRIRSDLTDQLVSKNHRCLVERDGDLVFQFAENLNSVERVPVLSYNIPYLQKGEGNILFTDLLWQDERLAKRLFSKWEGKKEPKEISLWSEEPKLERWSDLPEQERELYLTENKVCKVSERVYNDGEERWLRDGTSAVSGSAIGEAFIKDGSCASQESQCRRQQAGKSDAICDESGSQEVRGWKPYTTTLATVTREEYTGIVFCPTVSTGCFVARRNRKVFITGNSGFPKSMNIGLAIDKKNGVESETVGIGKSGSSSRAYQSEATTTAGEFEVKKATNDWAGWGTALKPSYEPIIVARKPFAGSLVDNVIKYGVGGLNIDECRVGDEIIGGGTMPDLRDVGRKSKEIIGIDKLSFGQVEGAERIEYESHVGRFPANTILTYDDTDYDEVCGDMPVTNPTRPHGGNGEALDTRNAGWGFKRMPSTLSDDGGSASRYFYCAKATKKDRDEGLKSFPEKTKVFNGKSNESSKDIKDVEQRFTTQLKNTHPTVKPCDLMQYLIRLVTPNGGTVLDPFNGSGSTGKATMYENREHNKGYKYIGIELTEEYLPISRARIEYVCNSPNEILWESPAENSNDAEKIIYKEVSLF